MKHLRTWVLVGVLSLIAIELMVIISILAGDIGGQGNIAVIKVEGPIESADEILKGLVRYRKSDKVKAIVMRIDSPGGAVGASQEIHDEILKTREEKPVIASFGNTAASGGYYIAVACDHIVSTAGAVTGSIGVITQFFQVDELLKKIDLRWQVIKSGENKDIGSPLKDLEPAQKQIMQDLIDDVFLQFVEAVATGRALDIENVKKLSDGRIYTGRQALELGLVDELGSITRAIEVAAEKANLQEDDVETFVYPKNTPGFFESLMGSTRLWPTTQTRIEYRMP